VNVEGSESSAVRCGGQDGVVGGGQGVDLSYEVEFGAEGNARKEWHLGEFATEVEGEVTEKGGVGKRDKCARWGSCIEGNDGGERTLDEFRDGFEAYGVDPVVVHARELMFKVPTEEALIAASKALVETVVDGDDGPGETSSQGRGIDGARGGRGDHANGPPAVDHKSGRGGLGSALGRERVLTLALEDAHSIGN
jgi:hypothetical protein